MSSEDASALRQHVHRFLRSFGLLACETTPCGQPLPVSYAHALMILDGVSGDDEAPTMGALARELGIDKSNVTRLCRRMQDAGHLEITRCGEDGRVRCLRLTAAGRRLAKQVERSSRRRFERILSHIPPERRAELLRGLDLLGEAVARTLEEEV
ncbi:MAG: MarR family transcriptional regulator [Planctomycetota bacterium]|nr:MAG: MarR family transcriptional regulator [Planctomycetota bacterium]